MPQITRSNVAIYRSQDHLSALAPELIEFITEWLPPRDVLSLRITCRTLHACSNRVYVRKFIATRPFLLREDHSMKQLVAMIANPEIRRHMQIVHLSSFFLYLPQDNTPRLERGLKKQGLKTREVREKKRIYKALHNDYMPPHVRNFGNHGEGDLVKLITQMREHAVNVGFKCTEFQWGCSNSEQASPWGYDRLSETLGYSDWLDEKTASDRAFRAVLLGLQKTKHAPRHLELGSASFGVDVALFDFIWPAPCLDDHPFHNLEVLRLSLTNLRESNKLPLRQMNNAGLLALRHALCDAPNIQTFGLTIRSNAHDEELLSRRALNQLFGADYSLAVLPKLRVLELRRHVVDVWDMALLLRNRQKTLRKVELRYIKNPPNSHHATFESQNTKIVESPVVSKELELMFKKDFPDCVFLFDRVYDGEAWEGEKCIFDCCVKQQ